MRFVRRLENGIADVMSRWAVRSGTPDDVFRMEKSDIAAIIAKKWSNLHEGHAGVSSMIYQERNSKIGVTMKEMKKQLKTCRVYQRNSDKRRSNMSTLNFSIFLGDVVGLDFVGLVEGVYLLIKVDYFTRVVQVDLCEKFDSKNVIRGLERWFSLRGNIRRIRTNGGTYFDNCQVAEWLENKVWNKSSQCHMIIALLA